MARWNKKPIENHGKCATPEYRAWCHMIGRCENEKDQDFINYGGRGIKVCYEWRMSFEKFYSDLGERPDGYSLERVDVNGNYCKDNCKWIPHKDQWLNKRNTRYYDYNGQKMTLKQIVELTGLPKTTVFRWLEAGQSLDKKPWARYTKP